MSRAFLANDSIKFTIVRGEKLPVGDQDGYSDPYCVIIDQSTKQTLHRTVVDRKTLNPRWNSTFWKRYKEETPKNLKLKINVYDWDDDKQDDFLGWFEIELDPNALNPDQTYETQHQLEDATTGRIWINYKWDTSERKPSAKTSTSTGIGSDGFKVITELNSSCFIPKVPSSFVLVGTNVDSLNQDYTVTCIDSKSGNTLIFTFTKLKSKTYEKAKQDHLYVTLKSFKDQYPNLKELKSDITSSTFGGKVNSSTKSIYDAGNKNVITSVCANFKNKAFINLVLISKGEDLAALLDDVMNKTTLLAL